MVKFFASLCAAALALGANAFADPIEEMLVVDRAFSKLAQTDGVPAAFAAYAAEDARMFPDGGAPYQGRDKVIARFSSWPEGATLSWTPIEGEAASSGDFGFTWGTYVFTMPGEGDDISEHGKYVSIWRKDADGAWKFILDIGNKSPAPESGD